MDEGGSGAVSDGMMCNKKFGKIKRLGKRYLDLESDTGGMVGFLLSVMMLLMHMLYEIQDDTARGDGYDLCLHA
jgi:hypothetical protein